MLKNFKALIHQAKNNPRRIAVASAEDEHVLQAVIQAKKYKIADFILTGDIDKIKTLLKKYGGKEKDYEFLFAGNFEDAAGLAVKMVKEDKANAVMKGLLPSPTFLKAVLHESTGIKVGTNVLAHVVLLKVPQWNKMFLASDCAVNISPTVADKKSMIDYSVFSAHKLGIAAPNVAIVTSSEVVNPKMKDTLDAQQLVEIFKDHKDCVVTGPYGLDNAISKEAAQIKKVPYSGAGDADILIFPDLTCANVFYKSLIFYARAQSAGVILGAKAPVILVSRSDSEETKLNSIAFACVIS